MSAFLIINGQPIEVQQGAATRREDIIAGAKRRSFNNTLRDGTRSPKKAWEFITGPMTTTSVATLRAAITSGFVPVIGTVVGEVMHTCNVDITNEEFIADDISHLHVLTLAIEEA